MKKQIKYICIVFCLILYSVLSPITMALHHNDHNNCDEHNHHETCLVCNELASRINLISNDDFDVLLQTSILRVNLPVFNTIYTPHKTLLQLDTQLIE